ncbi:MAG: hypothetical protein KAJ19_20635 [Gammaproteobacteria bacterium]|nr:hypothetical protein [Gammaproteobacteria bacterium]
MRAIPEQRRIPLVNAEAHRIVDQARRFLKDKRQGTVPPCLRVEWIIACELLISLGQVLDAIERERV